MGVAQRSMACTIATTAPCRRSRDDQPIWGLASGRDRSDCRPDSTYSRRCARSGPDSPSPDNVVGTDHSGTKEGSETAAIELHDAQFPPTALMVKNCMLRKDPCCYALNATTDVQRRPDAADSPHAWQQPIPHAVRIRFVPPELSAQHPVLLPRPNHHEHGVRCPWQQRSP